MKTSISLFGLLALSTSVTAATLTGYNGEACTYRGGVDRNNKPQGQGSLICEDGRRYTGQFENGTFHGRGRFSVPDRPNLVLMPLGGMRSGKLRGMELEGLYQNGQAQGKHTVWQQGRHTFSIDFEQGQIKAVTAP